MKQTSPYYKWELLFWLWLAFFLNQADRAIYGIVLPHIKKSLDLTAQQEGLIGSMLFWTLALMVPLAGYVGDIWSRRKITSYSLVFWSVATSFTGMARNWIHLVIFRSVATGGGEAFFAPAAYAMIGQHHLNILGSSQFDSACKETLQLRQPQQQILRTNFQGTKKTYQVSLVALPIKDDVPSGILAVFHDVTSLQLIQERQSDFVANASHELATPLTAIRGFAETLVDGAADHAADSRHFAAIILSEADRMQRLVQDLLQLAKIESAEYRQQFHYSATWVQPMLESVVRELTPVWLQKQLLVQLDPPTEPLWTMTDPDRLKQILVNLIDNAIKYTPDGGTIQVGAALVGNQIQFTVKDSGIGIPSEDLPRIFDRFYRIDKARARAVGGTGLGLAIVKHLLDALGGTIEVESRQDVGTTFRFYLPVANSGFTD